jgi:hypothetical protein
MGGAFRYTREFNQPLSWDTSNVQDMMGTFENAVKFNQPLNRDTSKVQNMSNMFQNATEFNQDISSRNISKVQNMSNMFSQAINFNQDISSRNFSGINGISKVKNFLYWSNLSTENYNKLLISRAAQTGMLNGLQFETIGKGQTAYGGCSELSEQAIAAHKYLTKPREQGGKGWILYDGGEGEICVPEAHSGQLTMEVQTTYNTQSYSFTLQGDTSVIIDRGDGTASQLSYDYNGGMQHQYATP